MLAISCHEYVGACSRVSLRGVKRQPNITWIGVHGRHGTLSPITDTEKRTFGQDCYIEQLQLSVLLGCSKVPWALPHLDQNQLEANVWI